MATRWGIVSAGKISSDFVTALSLLPKEEHCVEAVAARDLSKAREFAERFGIKRSYGSYEELAKDKDLDVIYIGSVHTMHFPLCKLFLGAGYNVLCEKPLVINSAQCQEVVALARAKNVFFMEAFWSRFFPVYDDLRKLLSSGEIGEPQFVSASFGMAVMHQNVERLIKKEVAGGALLDMGCYPIQFVQMVYNHEKPKILAAGFMQDSGVDKAVTAIFQYSGHRTAVINTSFICSLDNEATVCCSKMVNDTYSAIVKVENLWNPVRMVTPTGVVEHKLPKHNLPMNFLRGEGMIYEAQAVRDCLKKGLKEHPYMTLDNSLQICEIMDEIRQQLGVVYKEDLQK